jgi:hypothetical protein
VGTRENLLSFARGDRQQMRRHAEDTPHTAALLLRWRGGRGLAMAVFLVARLSSVARDAGSAPSTIATANLRRVGTVEEQFQSFNVEMLEVTGGKFWRPYGAKSDPPPVISPAASGDTPAGMRPDLYAYRPPLDLADPRLRALAAALGPAYVRISGTWANTTYFPDSDTAPAVPPPGFSGVLTRAQWRRALDFARAADALVVTSFAISPGTRDAAGVWTPTQAQRFVEYTASAGGRIAAAEFMNEPNLAAMGGAPAGYDAAAYGRDFKVFRNFARKVAPGMLILGPGSVGETASGSGVAYGGTPVLKTRDLVAASGPGINVFSYHHYGATSLRCAAMDHQTTAEAALTEEWLQRTDDTLAFYRSVRDEMEPNRPLWVTETADAACGGNPWAATFLDTFRYLDQLGRLARQGVQVVIHNTLLASDYGLLDDQTFQPKPNYWGALLWRKLMGTTVLDPGIPLQRGLHVYAHSLRGLPGGVALLVINTDRTQPRVLSIPVRSDRYTLSAASKDLRTRRIRLNARGLVLDANGRLPELSPVSAAAGKVSFEPETITFLAIANAGNAAALQPAPTTVPGDH